jgi:hypothetical protein
MLLAHISGEHRGDDAPPRIRIVGPSAIPNWVRNSIGSVLDGLWLRGFGRGQGQFFDRIAGRLSLGICPTVTICRAHGACDELRA